MRVLNNKQYLKKLQQRTQISKDSSDKYINTDVLAGKRPRSFLKALNYGEFFAENPVFIFAVAKFPTHSGAWRNP